MCWRTISLRLGFDAEEYACSDTPTAICSESDSTPSDCVVSSDGVGDDMPRDGASVTSCSTATGGTALSPSPVSIITLLFTEIPQQNNKF